MSIRAKITLIIFLFLSKNTLAQLGDFDGDGAFTIDDADLLSSAIVTGTDTEFDLDGNGVLNRDDMSTWLGLAGNANLGPGETYLWGDSNLAGNINLADLEIVGSFPRASSLYSEGDYNQDGWLDGFDAAILWANALGSFETVDGPGSDGTPTRTHADVFYDPGTGKLWLDMGGDFNHGWSITGPPALNRDELQDLNDFGTVAFSIGATYHINGAEHLVRRANGATGVFQAYTYPTGLTSDDFGEVVFARSGYSLLTGPTTPSGTDVTVATIRTWNGSTGNWNSANWSGSGTPLSSQVAVIDIGSGDVTLPANEIANSIETLVRGGEFHLDGTHVGNVTIFDSESTEAGSLAAISGNGQIDGDLVLMGKLVLDDLMPLTVTGQASLAAGYRWTGPVGMAQLTNTTRLGLESGESTGDFVLLSAEGGIEGVLYGASEIPLETGRRTASGLYIAKLEFTDTEIVMNLMRDPIPGDANFDGVVDVADFNLWNANKFTSGTTWYSGDFNGDGYTDVGDFNLWNENKFSDQPAFVPEPDGAFILTFFSILFGAVSRNRRNQERQ